MTAQEIVDRAEEEAIARFEALRAAFGPCWGVKAEMRFAVRRPSRRRQPG